MATEVSSNGKALSVDAITQHWTPYDATGAKDAEMRMLLLLPQKPVPSYKYPGKKRKQHHLIDSNDKQNINMKVKQKC